LGGGGWDLGAAWAYLGFICIKTIISGLEIMELMFFHDLLKKYADPGPNYANYTFKA
jgi:hypothetical protein